LPIERLLLEDDIPDETQATELKDDVLAYTTSFLADTAS
jgi:hypothetical protein